MTQLDSSLVGTTYEPQSLKADPERLRAYAAATKDERPEYMDETLLGGIVAPPLFAVVAELPAATLAVSGLALPMDRLLHGEQDMRFSSPIRPGDVLITESEIVDVSETSTGQTLTLELVTRTDAEGERTRSMMTLYLRDPSKRRVKSSVAESQRADPLARAAVTVRPDHPAIYAEASGDYNLPHTDEDFARRAGFRSVILQGLCTMAFASKAVVDNACEGDPTRLQRLKVRFSNVVYPGDTLTTSIWQDDGHFPLQTANQHGALVLRDGVAEVADHPSRY